MSARLVYLRLELKRACKKLPHIFAGAIVLLLLAGTIALLSARMLYGETSAGRITVGVVLPEGDAVAKRRWPWSVRWKASRASAILNI